MSPRVAIIGGGAASVLVAAELVAQAPREGLAIQWYRGVRGDHRGVAYATAHERHLLNVRAGGMDVDATSPDDFVAFAKRHVPDASAGDFLPRAVYGQYLQARVERTRLLAAARGIRIDAVRQEALLVDAVAGGRHAVLDSGDCVVDVDAAVFAIGALAPAPLPQVDAAARRARGFVVDPWTWLARATPDTGVHEIVVIGTGLTAIDMALAVAQRYPAARVRLVSRHGAVPHSHAATPAPPIAPSIDALAELLRAGTARRLTRALRRHLRAHDDWRAALDGLRASTPALWQSLPMRERAVFLRRLRWAWEVSRHRLAPEIADAFATLRAQGRVSIDAAHVQAVTTTGDSLAIALRRRGSTHIETWTADIVIQACGLDTDARSTRSPLVNGLLRSGVARADPLGLGLAATADGRLIGADAQPHDDLWLIGALRRADRWEATAIAELREQARAIAAGLLARLARRTHDGTGVVALAPRVLPARGPS